MEPHRPFIVEDPLREEQFRTQLPKLRLMTSVPLAPGEEWGTRADFSPLVEQRDIDFARVSLPNVGGITEMLKIMAVCDTHRVGIVPHFTGPIATAGQRLGPKSTSAARAMPVGAQTGVTMPCATGSWIPSLAVPM